MGEERTAISVTLRPTRAEHDQMERVCRAYGLTREQLLSRAVKLGLERLVTEARATGLEV